MGDGPAKPLKTDHFDNAGEPKTDSGDIQKARRELAQQIARGDYNHPTTTTKPGGDIASITGDVVRNLASLHQMGDQKSGVFSDRNGGTHDRGELVADTDRKFQALMGAVQQGARGQAGEIFSNLTKVDDYDKRLTDMQLKIRKEIPADTLKQLGLDGDKPLTPEQVQNAVLKAGLTANPSAPRSQVVNDLTDYLALSEMKAEASGAANQATRDLKAPTMVALAYADFLTRFKDGVTTTTTTDGKVVPVTAANIVDQVSKLDMAQAKQPAEQTQEQAMQSQVDLLRKQGVPDDKNPLITIQAAMKDKNNLSLWQKAAQQSDDPMFDPAKLGPEMVAKIKALNDFEQTVKDGKIPITPEIQKKDQDLTIDAAGTQLKANLRASAYLGLGQAELAQDNPDFDKAKTHLQTAVNSNPNMTDDQRKQANQANDGMIQARRLMHDHPEVKGFQDFMSNDDSKKQYVQFHVDAANVQKTIISLEDAIKQGKKPTDEQIDAARKQFDAFYNEGKALQTALAPAAGGIDKAYNDLSAKKNRTPQEDEELANLSGMYQAAHGGTFAAMKQAYLYAKTGDSPAAKDKLEEAAKDTAVFANQDNKQLLDNYTNIVKEAQMDEHPFAKWGKWIGAGAGLVAGWALATALAPETLGASWAAMGAVTAGMVGGGVFGTAVGTTIEVGSGGRDSIWDGVKDTAPLAFTAASIGGAMASIPAVTLATGRTVVGVGAAEGLAPAGAGLAQGELFAGANLGLAPAVAAEAVPGVTVTVAGATVEAGAVTGEAAATTGANAASKVGLIGRVWNPVKGWVAEQAAPITTRYQALAPAYNEAKAINTFQGIANSWESLPTALGSSRPYLAYLGANATKFGFVGAVGGIGELASDHPFTNYGSYVGTAVAAAPFKFIGMGGQYMPKWVPAKELVNFMGIGVAGGAIDYTKNLAIAPFDSRGGDLSIASKAWATTSSEIFSTGAVPMAPLPYISAPINTAQRDGVLALAKGKKKKSA